jgi:hypothetical protein
MPWSKKTMALIGISLSMNNPQWRPRNETEEDLRHETNAALAVANRFGCAVTKLSEALYHIDWVISRDGAITAVAEYKRRKNSVDAYPTLLLSAAKWKKGMDYAELFGVPFILFVEWDEGLYYLKAERSSVVRFEVGGNSRGQNGDYEPLVHLNIAHFVRA